MRKRLLGIIIATMLILTACGEKTLQKESIILYHATDMHYLSQQLTDNSPAFVEYIRNGDGKMVHYIEAIMEAFVNDISETKPDYLLIGGDITFNGEKQSHIDIAEKFRRIEENGTQVLVIPGNHDVDYPFNFGYSGNSMYKTDRIQKSDFEQIYKDFGLSQAYSRDEKSFSYFYRLTDKFVLLALDTNTAGGTGVLDASTVQWIENELKKLKSDVKVIALTHQNAVNHFPGDSFGKQYYIINNKSLLDLFEKYNVQLNLSGHIHTQHKAEYGTVTDIATESLAVLPCNYGVIECTPQGFFYDTTSVNVEKWAQENNVTDENLADFDNYSKEFYMASQRNLCKDTLVEETGLSEKEINLMSDFFAELNVYYFAGNIDEHELDLSLSDGYNMWQEKGKDLWHYHYIEQRMEEGRQALNHDSAQILFN